MPVVRAAETTVHEMHNARFTPLIRPGTGSKEVCVWQLEIAAGTIGVEHRILREEAFVLLSGAAIFTVEGESAPLEPGDAAVAPAESTIRLDNPGEAPATLMVIAPVGFAGELADGTRITPPWVS
ncbi:cupin domain-containing protein [Nocardia amamiensis]|uniref:cupin domain-containing protein n=1 Tax=Nocardia TaxID=1817 RepID=UPI0033F56207